MSSTNPRSSMLPGQVPSQLMPYVLMGVAILDAAWDVLPYISPDALLSFAVALSLGVQVRRQQNSLP